MKQQIFHHHLQLKISINSYILIQKVLLVPFEKHFERSTDCSIINEIFKKKEKIKIKFKSSKKLLEKPIFFTEED